MQKLMPTETSAKNNKGENVENNCGYMLYAAVVFFVCCWELTLKISRKLEEGRLVLFPAFDKSPAYVIQS